MSEPNGRNVDDVDRQIIELLMEDGRMSIQEVARRLSSTAATVRTRIRRLEESGVLRVVAVTDFAAAGFEMLLAIGIEVESRSAEQVGHELAALPEVFSVNMTTGTFDLEVLVAAQGYDDLNRFLTDELAGIKGIARLEPGLCIDVLKYQSEWAPEL
ncbi:MAG: Lrp/AsnC family transcriptional regulator [Alphaproteobacteria bacterium]